MDLQLRLPILRPILLSGLVRRNIWCLFFFLITTYNWAVHEAGGGIHVLNSNIWGITDIWHLKKCCAEQLLMLWQWSCKVWVDIKHLNACWKSYAMNVHTSKRWQVWIIISSAYHTWMCWCSCMNKYIPMPHSMRCSFDVIWTCIR